MENRKRHWLVTIAVVGLVVAAFLALTGMSYARWGTPLGWTGIGACRTGIVPWTSPSAGEVGEVGVTGTAEAYVASYRCSDLMVAEIMEFDNHYYVEVMEESTGRYAFEFLIDRATGRATPEPGPNMMWNLKYGHMAGGMMGRFGRSRIAAEAMPVSEEDAIRFAQEYLDRFSPLPLEVEHHAAAFYGYYTLHTLRDGEIDGMLSVNGITGDVWYHTWHGAYIGNVVSELH